MKMENTFGFVSEQIPLHCLSTLITLLLVFCLRTNMPLHVTTAKRYSFGPLSACVSVGLIDNGRTCRHYLQHESCSACWHSYRLLRVGVRGNSTVAPPEITQRVHTRIQVQAGLCRAWRMRSALRQRSWKGRSPALRQEGKCLRFYYAGSTDRRLPEGYCEVEP